VGPLGGVELAGHPAFASRLALAVFSETADLDTLHTANGDNHGVGGREMPRVSLNQVAPDFRLPDFSGSPVSLSDYRDRKNVLLVFNRGFT
jgi:hypothetical protein